MQHGLFSFLLYANRLLILDRNEHYKYGNKFRASILLRRSARNSITWHAAPLFRLSSLQPKHSPTAVCIAWKGIERENRLRVGWNY